MLDFKPFQTVKISTVISYKYLKSLFFYSYFPIPPQQTHEADDYRGAYHCVAENMKQLLPLCGSKHVQSNTVGIYRKTKELLTSGRTVMFVGMPCQVAALLGFLGKEYDNLLAADFICNSINSPKAQANI